MFGRAAEEEFSDAIVTRPDMVALRRKVVATVDDSIDESAADITAMLTDGRRVHLRVEHAADDGLIGIYITAAREKAEGLSPPSNPQIFVGRAIAEKLRHLPLAQ